MEKAPKQSKKWLLAAAGIGAAVVLGVLDAVLRARWGVPIPEQAWTLAGELGVTYLGAQGIVDLGVRVSAHLQGKTSPAAVAAATAAAEAEVGALSPSAKSLALSDLK